MIPLAAMFLQVLQELKELPDTSHAMVLVEEISLAYARRLFDCGNTGVNILLKIEKYFEQKKN